ncbi:MAG: MBL fold metallo-hydrolase [Ruminococcus sp.]|nr:MBL fold metallo-hydrolase [Ruminococcus sp.]
MKIIEPIKRILLLAAAIWTALTAAACGKRDPSALTVTFIDVGKGDCILAECGGCTLMIDTGFSETAENVLAHLSDHGIKKLDAMIITHYDKDHVGGAAEIAESIPVSQIYLPDYKGRGSEYKSLVKVINKNGISANTVSQDTVFSLGGVEYTVLASDIAYDSSGKEGNDNDVSLVVSAVHGNDSYLFAGDIEKDGIKSLLNKLERKYDVLKMPHHGRKAGNTEKLIAAVGAKIAVITDSEDDPADKKVLSLLSETEVLRSAVSGDITIESRGNGEYGVSAEK